MSWQLWVLIAAAAAALMVLLAVRLRRARQVFDLIVEAVDDDRADEVAGQRRERERTHRGPGVVGHARHHH